MIINAHDKEFEFIPDKKGKHSIVINGEKINGFFREENEEPLGFKNGSYSYVQEMVDLYN